MSDEQNIDPNSPSFDIQDLRPDSSSLVASEPVDTSNLGQNAPINAYTPVPVNNENSSFDSVQDKPLEEVKPEELPPSASLPEEIPQVSVEPIIETAHNVAMTVLATEQTKRRSFKKLWMKLD